VIYKAVHVLLERMPCYFCEPLLRRLQKRDKCKMKEKQKRNNKDSPRAARSPRCSQLVAQSFLARVRVAHALITLAYLELIYSPRVLPRADEAVVPGSNQNEGSLIDPRHGSDISRRVSTACRATRFINPRDHRGLDCPINGASLGYERRISREFNYSDRPSYAPAPREIVPFA